MRIPISAILLAAGAITPAFAHSDDQIVFAPGIGDSSDAVQSGFSDSDTDSISDPRGLAGQMADPHMQDNVADTIERVSAALLFVPVGPIAEAIDKARPGTIDSRIGYDTRLGDLAGRDAANLPRKLGERSRDAMGMAGDIAQAIATMMPEFERMGREMEESFRTAKAQARND